jgi:hypothetical protein
MDHLDPAGLKDPPEDVDRDVMTVEEGGGCDKPQLVDRPVDARR